MSIYAEKRGGIPTGKLVVEVQIDGKVVKRRVNTKREANLLEATMKAGGLAKADAQTMKVAELYEATKGLWQGHKDEANSLRKLKRVCDILGLDTVVSTINSSLVDRLHETLRASGLARPTINRHNAVLSRILDWAVERDHLPKMPRIAWFQEPRQKFSWLEPADEARVVQWLTTEGNVRGDLGGKVALIVQVLTLTGMRIGELAKAQPDHIDVLGETVTLWDTKTRDSRTQYLPADLGRRLRAMKEADAFPSYQAIQGVFYRARDALKLDPKLTIHGLRHSTATRLAGEGVNQKIIMDYMGHRSMHTTNRYTHVNAAAKKTAAQVLMGLIAPPDASES